MNLRGQEQNESGYAMAALLVAIAVMTVLLSVAMPVWRHEMQREREAELVFRGEQYVRAIDLFQRKYPGTSPPSIDVLVSQKFLRKKYKDPMIEDGEFRLIYAGQAQATPGAPGAPGQEGTSRQPGVTPTVEQQGRGTRQPRTTPGGEVPGSRRAGQSGAQQPGFGVGGIIGVASKSKEKSILIYKGRSKYEEWPFVFANIGAQPGGPGGASRPGFPGGQPRPGQPGRPGQQRPGQPDRPGQVGPGIVRPGTDRPPVQRPPGSGPIPR
jgi:type II secretory pathway pseudopilin PulG